jgi:hypothetical protein
MSGMPRDEHSGDEVEQPEQPEQVEVESSEVVLPMPPMPVSAAGAGADRAGSTGSGDDHGKPGPGGRDDDEEGHEDIGEGTGFGSRGGMPPGSSHDGMPGSSDSLDGPWCGRCGNNGEILYDGFHKVKLSDAQCPAGPNFGGCGSVQHVSHRKLREGMVVVKSGNPHTIAPFLVTTFFHSPWLLVMLVTELAKEKQHEKDRFVDGGSCVGPFPEFCNQNHQTGSSLLRQSVVMTMFCLC